MPMWNRRRSGAAAALVLLGGGALAWGTLETVHASAGHVNRDAQAATASTDTPSVCDHAATAGSAQIDGVVVTKNGSSLAVTTADALPYTVNLDGTTKYQRGNQGASASDVMPGSVITAVGAANGASLKAAALCIDLSTVSGTVTAVNGAQITVTSDGFTHTVVATGATAYSSDASATASAASVKVGMDIDAEGTLSTGGQTLTAQSISVSVPDTNQADSTQPDTNQPDAARPTSAR